MIGRYDESKAFDFENGFYLTSKPYRLGNMLSHYELYKMIIGLPGDIIELGVFKGGGFIQFATFRNLLENENAHKIIGFDVFGNFPMTEHVESDKEFERKWNEGFKGDFLKKNDLLSSFSFKGINNIELVEGDITITVAQYLKRCPQTRVAMLHVDCDVYEPAKVGLELLFDRVVHGGVVIFDDYAVIEGETLAVDEFLGGKDYIIRKFPFSHAKPSYIIKK